MTTKQLDLFAWPEHTEVPPSSTSAPDPHVYRRGQYDHLPNVVDMIPHVVRQMVRKRHQPRVRREGHLVDFPPSPRPIDPDIRRTA